MNRSHLRVYVHLVWSTWDREPLIPACLTSRLHAVIKGACEKLGCAVLALGGMPDHVHLLVSLGPSASTASVAHAVKGASSRWLNEQPEVAGEFRWQGRYGAFSVSPHERSRVTAYIHNQEQHHTDGTLWPSVETFECSADS
jgi:putative transposase